ncbi:MAG: acetyl-CoA acetyltransferase, partial [Acidimicrobiaceae bacterium]|nr:acetyl-CoA acetyltransferase [Acidimicrobiaceae bacterium]
MSSHGITDRVAVIGMGCTPFAEHWDASLDDLIIDAAHAAYRSAGMAQDDIDAFWFGTSQSAASGLGMAGPLKIQGKPVTRVENYCATGSEALRQACYAV